MASDGPTVGWLRPGDRLVLAWLCGATTTLGRDDLIRLLGAAAPLVPAAWREAACPAGRRPRRVPWEVALAFAVRDAPRSGNLFLAASRRHVSFWNLLVGEERWEEAKQDAHARLPVPPRPDEALAALRARFDEATGAAARGLPRSLSARVQGGELRLRQPGALPLSPGLRSCARPSRPACRGSGSRTCCARWTAGPA
jgi:hypothetical protein